MFVYSFPFAGQAQSKLSLVDHTHNYELQILMEQGFVGLFGFLLLTGLLGILTFAIVRRFRKTGRGMDATGILMLVLLPEMIGKLFEL